MPTRSKTETANFVVLRKMLGAGTPRELKTRAVDMVLLIFGRPIGLCRPGVPIADCAGRSFRSDPWISRPNILLLTGLKMAGYTTDC
jgi:hypothetical protein